jgi:hypothetical protein
MLVVSVARQLGSGNSFDRLLCCPAEAERGWKRRSEPAKLTMPALALWYRPRTADSRIGTRKTMIVALARKLVIALWRFVTTGEPLEGVVLRPAA